MDDGDYERSKKWYIEFKGLIVFSIVFLLFSLSIKFLIAPVLLADSPMTVSDVLSIFVSFFAIAMSFAFYFQASQTSNSFYDNTYKFTKDVSETLGRMEGVFGEKLTHLDSNYTRIDQKMERVFDPESARQEIIESKSEAVDSAAKKDDLIRKLTERANMQESEKNEFFNKIREAEESLINSREKIAFLESELARREAMVRETGVRDGRFRKISDIQMKFHARRALLPLMGGDRIIKNASYREIIEGFSKIIDDISPEFLSDLRELGYLNGNQLSKSGVEWIRNLV